MYKKKIISLIYLILILMVLSVNSNNKKTLDVYFAGGCFWCMEEVFQKTKGVVKAISGYTGGDLVNPTYDDISHKKTGHYEAVRINYDPTIITYEQLLEIFWVNVDPTQGNGQFCDKGNQYRSVIFFENKEQKKTAENSKLNAKKNLLLSDPIVTEIIPLKTFYPAEEYHQDYFIKNPYRYKTYKYFCGRAQRLKAIWNKK